MEININEFEPIKEFPDYGVNYHGDVLNFVTNRFLLHHVGTGGHIYVSLRDQDGSRKVRALGRLVAEAYLPEPDMENQNTVIHLDYDYVNNSADNLVWRPRWFAIQYHKQAKLDSYPYIDREFIDVDSGRIYDNSHMFCIEHGALDLDVATALANDRPLLYPRLMNLSWLSNPKTV